MTKDTSFSGRLFREWWGKQPELAKRWYLRGNALEDPSEG